MRKKRRKLKKKVIPFILIVFLILIYILLNIIGTNIKNIYVKGNILYTDQEIIDLAQIQDYPNVFSNPSYIIKKRLENDLFIKNAKVRKEGIFKIVIIVEENYPLYYYKVEDKVILLDGTSTNKIKANITVINQIPDTIYKDFYKKMKDIDITILSRISEIKYSPNDVDEERFFITMNDGNYVYITIDRFNNLNKYLDILKKFEGKSGIIHLDAGEYFEVFDK